MIPTGITNIKLSLPNAGFLHLVFLAVVPTIGGFYFTSKALNNTEASKVQIILRFPFLKIITTVETNQVFINMDEDIANDKKKTTCYFISGALNLIVIDL